MNGVIAIVVALVVIVGAYLLLQSPADDVATIPTDEDVVVVDPMVEEDMDEAMDPVEPPTVVGAAIETPELSTLVTAVSEAGLVDTLQGEGPFTVFAPTNAAFDALPEGTLDTLLSEDGSEQLTSVLTYHVVPGEFAAADLADGATLTTVNGETITVTLDGGVTLNEDVMVVQADVMTGNGIVHVIDGVLLP
jgi:uncharacterized surface protein with fasciclin (FAS1) repeats